MNPPDRTYENLLAHGMLDDNASQSSYTIYAWWLTLKLVVNSVIDESDKNTDADDNAADD